MLANALTDTPYDVKYELERVAHSIEAFLETQEMASIAHDFFIKRNCFYIGRDMDYYTSLEASLKLKEISYIQTEGFAAGELKHGTIALIENHTPVIAIISNPDISKNTRSNLNEVITRGAHALIISLESVALATDQIVLKDCDPLLSSMVTIVPAQLLSYYAALERGLDIDKPRNLAKSVTVE
jgi:glucosamine--fructose-6-phosphate aminotransferase (isomerizing)